MRNEQKIKAMRMQIDFEVGDGRIGVIEVSMSAADMVSIPLRNFVDERIEAFIKKHSGRPKSQLFARVGEPRGS